MQASDKDITDHIRNSHVTLASQNMNIISINCPADYWHSIQCLFPLHAQRSLDRLQIHCDQDVAVTEEERLNYSYKYCIQEYMSSYTT